MGTKYEVAAGSPTSDLSLPNCNRLDRPAPISWKSSSFVNSSPNSARLLCFSAQSDARARPKRAVTKFDGLALVRARELDTSTQSGEDEAVRILCQLTGSRRVGGVDGVGCVGGK